MAATARKFRDLDARITAHRKEADRLDDLHPTPVKAAVVKSNFESPESSTIASASYDDVTGKLMVVFRHGKAYSYEGLQPEVWKAFLLADSKGKFFSTYIRPNFKGVPLSVDKATTTRQLGLSRK